MFRYLKNTYQGLQLIVVVLPGKTPVYGEHGQVFGQDTCVCVLGSTFLGRQEETRSDYAAVTNSDVSFECAHTEMDALVWRTNATRRTEDHGAQQNTPDTERCAVCCS